MPDADYAIIMLLLDVLLLLSMLILLIDAFTLSFIDIYVILRYCYVIITRVEIMPACRREAGMNTRSRRVDIDITH